MTKLFFILLLLTNTIFADKTKIDSYLKKWLNKKDAALMFNYKTGEVLYEYNSYMFDSRIPIGSIFKIVTTFSFIQKNKTNYKTYNHICIPKKNKDLPCWNKKGHGKMNLRSAFVHSCNDFFYSLDISLNIIKKNINYLGLSIDLDLDNLNQREKKMFLAGNLLTIKANFYELSKLISIFANNGAVIDIKNQKKLYNVVEIKTINIIKNYMLEVIQKGTAHKVFFKGYGLSGKTGTSKDETGTTNGVFIGFIKDKPYAIIVNLNNNIGSTSAMIASDIIYLYLKL